MFYLDLLYIKKRITNKLWFVFSNVWGTVSMLQSPSLNGDEGVLGKPGLFGRKSQKKSPFFQSNLWAW